jgi:hypothetical protein
MRVARLSQGLHTQLHPASQLLLRVHSLTLMSATTISANCSRDCSAVEAPAAAVCTAVSVLTFLRASTSPVLGLLLPGPLLLLPALLERVLAVPLLIRLSSMLLRGLVTGVVRVLLGSPRGRITTGLTLLEVAGGLDGTMRSRQGGQLECRKQDAVAQCYVHSCPGNNDACEQPNARWSCTLVTRYSLHASSGPGHWDPQSQQQTGRHSHSLCNAAVGMSPRLCNPCVFMLFLDCLRQERSCEVSDTPTSAEQQMRGRLQ